MTEQEIEDNLRFEEIKFRWLQNKGMVFVEIADCHEKVRLHMTPTDTKADFTAKLIKLRDGLTNFIEHLQSV